MPSPDHATVLKNLAALGLSEHDAAVYLAVLAKEEVTAGDVLEATQLHREQVYRALKRLVDGGYATQFEKRKRATYAAVDPEVFVHRANANRDIATSLQPYLKELHAKRSHVIQVNEGIESLSLLMDDILATLKDGGEYLVMGGAQDLFATYARDILPKYQKKFAKAGISARITGFAGQAVEEEVKTAAHGVTARLIPGEPTIPSSVVVYGDTVCLEVFDPMNVAVITIKNQRVADSYREAFERLWKMGKPLK